jgi:hypothetical protein
MDVRSLQAYMARGERGSQLLLRHLDSLDQTKAYHAASGLLFSNSTTFLSWSLMSRVDLSVAFAPQIGIRPLANITIGRDHVQCDPRCDHAPKRAGGRRLWRMPIFCSAVRVLA